MQTADSLLGWTDDQGELTYCLEGSLFNAGTVVQWLRDGLGIIETADEINRLAAGVENSGGVMLVPAFTGWGTPHWDPGARHADRFDPGQRSCPDRPCRVSTASPSRWLAWCSWQRSPSGTAWASWLSTVELIASIGPPAASTGQQHRSARATSAHLESTARAWRCWQACKQAGDFRSP